MGEKDNDYQPEQIEAEVLSALDELTAQEDAVTIEALRKGIDVRKNLGLPPRTSGIPVL